MYSAAIGLAGAAVYTQYFILQFHDYNGVGFGQYAYIFAIYWLMMFVAAFVPIFIALRFNKVHKKWIIRLVAIALPLLMVGLFDDWAIAHFPGRSDMTGMIRDMLFMALYPAALIWAVFDKREPKVAK